MRYVFNSKATMWFRFKVWFRLLMEHLTALPEFLNPKPLRPSKSTEEDGIYD